MKPIIIIPPDTISADDIQQLRDNELCVVVSKEPAAVKFLDPIPAMTGRTQVEEAAIRLSRVLLDREKWISDTNTWISRDRRDVAVLYVELLCKGTPLDPAVSEREHYFDNVKRDETAKIAREEARAERAAKIAEKAKGAK